MPRKYTTEHTVYKYAELSDDAKEKARDWYRSLDHGCADFAEYVTDSFHEELKALGFDPYRPHSASAHTGALRSTVQWSGFWSQGDGASFGGTWRAADMDAAKLLADRPADYVVNGEPGHSKENAELHRIAAELQACKDAGMTYVTINQSHRGFFMSLDSAEHDQPVEFDNDEDADAYTALCKTAEERFIEAARDLAHAFYRALEAEYTYQNSDEQVAETIEANEYEFTEDGGRA